MSAIDRVKELLAAAEKDSVCNGKMGGREHCPGCTQDAALTKLEGLAIPIAEELVASQEALEGLYSECESEDDEFPITGPESITVNIDGSLVVAARDALRLEKLEGVMEEGKQMAFDHRIAQRSKPGRIARRKRRSFGSRPSLLIPKRRKQDPPVS